MVIFTPYIRQAIMILLRTICAGIAAILVSTCSRHDAPAPHIIVLIADDLGLGDAPCHGGDRMPFMENRCASSLVFERVYTHPYCTASRAALMTGRHPLRHGASDVSADAIKLPLSEVTLAEIVKTGSSFDYETATFGKWHLADDHNGSERNPNLQGFDHFEGTPRQHHTYRYFDFDWYVNGQLSDRKSEYRTTVIVDAVINHFRARPESRPQLTLVSFTSPHKPYHAPPSSLHSLGELPPISLRGTRSDQPGSGEYRVNRREPRFDVYYQAMLEALDHELERLIGTLSTETDRPIIFVFVGDNGTAEEVYSASDETHIRSKATLYDGGVRVPLMVWSSRPELLPIVTGRTSRLLHLADLFSTLADLAGVSPAVEVDLGDEIDSRSFSASLLLNRVDDGRSRDFAFFERGNDERLPFAYGAVDRQGLKLILREPGRQNNHSRGVLVEVYDTARDRLETNNLINSRCAVPAEPVFALFEFIIAKADKNTAHSDWFAPDLYRSELTRAFNGCAL